MASDKQIQANRLNAQKSTGPQSPEGKKRVAQNRLKHGLAAQHVVLANEDKSAFENLLATLNDQWAPDSETEAFLVETIAYNQWRLLRIARMEQASLSGKQQSCGGEARLTMDVEDLSRYEGRSRRAYHSAINMLIKVQLFRQKQPCPPPPPQQQVESAEASPSVKAPGNGAERPATPPVTAIRLSNPIPPGEAPGPPSQPPLPDAA